MFGGASSPNNNRVSLTGRFHWARVRLFWTHCADARWIGMLRAKRSRHGILGALSALHGVPGTVLRAISWTIVRKFVSRPPS